MGLLAGLRKKNQASNQASDQSNDQTTQAQKTELRLYLDRLIERIDSLEMDGAKVPGLPFAVNPKQFLPLIARQVSDEMLEQIADFILIVARDLEDIRAREDSIIDADVLTDETKPDIAEL